MDKWAKRLKWMRVSKYAIIICFILSLVFAGFTVYGANTGNFTVYMQPSDVNLAIYMQEDKSDLGSRLSVPTLDRMNDTTYENIVVQEVRGRITEGLGSKNDTVSAQYMAFSFCVVNLSEQRSVDLQMELTVTETRTGYGGGEVINAMRVLFFEGDDFSKATIYALPESSEENKAWLEENTSYTTVDFISEVQIFDTAIYGIEKDAEVKFTMVIWLEGWDKDCVDDLFGSKIKMRLDITGV